MKTMKKLFYPAAFLAVLLFSASWLVSCSDDDDDNNNPPPGNSVISFENVTASKEFVQSGTFAKNGNANILPGESVTFTFNAGKGQFLAFATMYSYSNDMFFAPDNPGLPLFNSDGTAITGDVSRYVQLWDNGTRINQAPGANITRPGTAELANVTKVPGTDAQSNTYPAASELMRVELSYDSPKSEFTVIITNISNGTSYETPFSPGVWAISNRLENDIISENPLFTAGERSTEELTALAENGNNTPLYNKVKDNTGIITTLSQALVVVYYGDVNPIYRLSNKDSNNGLKEYAQKGNVTPLRNYLQTLPNVANVYVVGNDPVKPGEKMEVSFQSLEGYNLAYVTQFRYSNDWFFGNISNIASTEKGDMTSKTRLLDNGTAVNQYPGAGNFQIVFNGGNSQTESENIAVVGTTYPVPAVANMIKVTLK